MDELCRIATTERVGLSQERIAAEIAVLQITASVVKFHASGNSSCGRFASFPTPLQRDDGPNPSSNLHTAALGVALEDCLDVWIDSFPSMLLPDSQLGMCNRYVLREIV